MTRKVNLFGLQFWAITLEEAVEILAAAGTERRKGLVVTPNVDHVVAVNQNPLARAAYDAAEWVFADGMPIVWLSRLLPGRRLPARVTGADLLPALATAAPKHNLRLFFCGGESGVADQIVERLRKRIPGLNVAGTYSPPVGFERDARATDDTIAACNAARPDILFLGLGTPKQEIWAHQNLARLDVGPILCVGGAFDFAAGTKPRAPRWMQATGLEWTWRLAREPRRLGRRYLLQDAAFFGLALKELIGRPKSSRRANSTT